MLSIYAIMIMGFALFINFLRGHKVFMHIRSGVTEVVNQLLGALKLDFPKVDKAKISLYVLNESINYSVVYFEEIDHSKVPEVIKAA